jgi:hypothetical protein
VLGGEVDPLATPSPASRGLGGKSEEKEDWFVRTGTPAASPEQEPDEVVVVAPTAPNPQIYVFALLVAVMFGVAILGIVYLMFA